MTQASCSEVVPNSCMCRIAAIAYMATVVGAKGCSNGYSGEAALLARMEAAKLGSVRGRPARVMSATSALAERDRLGGVADMEDVGRAAAIGRSRCGAAASPDSSPWSATPDPSPAQKYPSTSPRPSPASSSAPLAEFGMELRQRFVVGLAGRMLVDAGDIGLALDAHAARLKHGPGIVDGAGRACPLADGRIGPTISDWAVPSDCPRWAGCLWGPSSSPRSCA